MKPLRAPCLTVIGNPAEKSKWRGPSLRWLAALAAASCTFASMATHADDADFAKSKKCLNCHAIDQKLVGPAFKAVASRYANGKDAEARLAKKIREGGSGAWGVVPMPANGEVDAADAQRLAHWVLQQK